MPYATPLLIRGINNLSDARYCAGMGADKLSFVLDPSVPGFLAPGVVKELAGWVAGVEIIGEFDQLSAPEINALAADCGLDAVLLRRPRPAADLAEIAPPIYLELPLAEVRMAGELTGLSSQVLGYVVELGNADETAATAVVAELSPQGAVWLGPDLSPAAASALARVPGVAGLVFPAGNEIKPGLRDFDQLEAVFEALEVE